MPNAAFIARSCEAMETSHLRSSGGVGGGEKALDGMEFTEGKSTVANDNTVLSVAMKQAFHAQRVLIFETYKGPWIKEAGGNAGGYQCCRLPA